LKKLPREIYILIVSERYEDLTRLLEYIRKEYPDGYFPSPRRNERPPYKGGYRIAGTICIEENEE